MAKHKVKRFFAGSEGETVGEAVGDSNEGMKEARDAYDEMQRRAKEEGANISEGERVSNMPASAKPAKAEKAKVVTKEELEKSGLSLRDYLNKQQGLTRREAAKPAMSDAEAMAKRMVPRFNPAGAAPKQSMGRQRQPFMPGDVDNSFPGAKFKGGGKVRSASARADGIAIRGKTRA
jgi:type II secretory pathway component HofQ